jgi:hypothetical protein
MANNAINSIALLCPYSPQQLPGHLILQQNVSSHILLPSEVLKVSPRPPLNSFGGDTIAPSGGMQEERQLAVSNGKHGADDQPPVELPDIVGNELPTERRGVRDADEEVEAPRSGVEGADPVAGLPLFGPGFTASACSSGHHAISPDLVWEVKEQELSVRFLGG